MSALDLGLIGGFAGLETILTDFYRRVFADPMIGYMFKGRDLQRLVSLEVQFTARAFGTPTPYEGRGMRMAHAALRVTGGQFDRRLQILRETLQDHDVDPRIQEAWLGHGRALRRAVVAGACDDAATSEPEHAQGRRTP
jgi:hemoglobin